MENNELTLYSVEFDTRFGDQKAHILNYRFMRNSEVLMTPIPEELNNGKGMVLSAKAGWMKQGTSLYVKWLDDETGIVHEATADLRGKLPGDMSNKNIRFTVKGTQLSVYVLFSNEPPNVPASERPFFATSIKFVKIYPQ